jgi:hypothetical protein
MFEYGFPPPRIVNSAVVLKSQRAPNGAEWYARSGKPFQDAGRKTTPSSGSPVVTKRQSANDQFACQRDDHCLARATTAIGGAGAIPHCERALLLKHQKAPGELDHAAADPGVAGSGEPLFAPLRAALIRRAC